MILSIGADALALTVGVQPGTTDTVVIATSIRAVEVSRDPVTVIEVGLIDASAARSAAAASPSATDPFSRAAMRAPS